jgi:hypothetical protein
MRIGNLCSLLTYLNVSHNFLYAEGVAILAEALAKSSGNSRSGNSSRSSEGSAKERGGGGGGGSYACSALRTLVVVEYCIPVQQWRDGEGGGKVSTSLIFAGGVGASDGTLSNANGTAARIPQAQITPVALHSGGLEMEDCVVLAALARANPCLTRIDLSHCNVQPTGLVHLVSGIY